MRRACLILFIAAVYAGCARPVPELEPAAEPVSGGVVRVAVDRSVTPTELTYLDQIEQIPADQGDAAALSLVGEADLSLVFGSDVNRLQKSRLMVRAAGWDRAYFLWCDPSFRWTADPNFRRWLGDTLDRRSLSEIVLAGEASPIWSLVGDATGAVWAPPIAVPFASTSSPVLRLYYDETDPLAHSIAARLRAALEPERVEVRLVTEPTQRVDLRLMRVPHGEDDAASLEALVQELRPQHRGASSYATSGAWELAHQALLLEAQAIPLVRSHAWFAVAPELEGVRPGVSGDLGLRDAWWRR